MTTRRVVFTISEKSDSEETESDVSEEEIEEYAPTDVPVNVVVEDIPEVLPSDTQKDTQIHAQDAQIPAQKDTQDVQKDTQELPIEVQIPQELVDKDERARQSVNKAMKSYYYRNKEKILAKRKESRRLKALDREKAKILLNS